MLRTGVDIRVMVPSSYLGRACFTDPISSGLARRLPDAPWSPPMMVAFREGTTVGGFDEVTSPAHLSIPAMLRPGIRAYSVCGWLTSSSAAKCATDFTTLSAG